MSMLSQDTARRLVERLSAPPPRTVADLQRELLAVCRGGSFAETWRKVNGVVEWPSLKSQIGKLAHVRQLRKQIVAIDPNACLYFGWAGPGDDVAPATGYGRVADGGVVEGTNRTTSGAIWQP
jgi:hypothetical protein